MIAIVQRFAYPMGGTMKKKRAFTLVEIMIVVLIIGILLAIAVPNFMQARDSSRAKSCVSNLHEIDSAKEQAAMDLKLADTDTPTQAQLCHTYIKAWPSCPSAGTYTIAAMNANPTCSIGAPHI